MDLKGKLRQGMRIFGADNRDYGTVERFDDDYVYVGGRRVPTSAFERFENDRLYVGQSGSQYFSEARGQQTEGQIRVPVVEERLDVEKRPVELGEVGIRKEVETEQVSVPVELAREEVDVERVDVKDRPLSTAEATTAFQEGTVRVPVRGEEAVVEKEAVVTGEVVVNKEQTTERQTITDTVRKMRVEVEENYQKDRPWFQEHFAARKGAGPRTFEEAEPSYQMGYSAGYDERYAGREWNDVEPHLRREYETTGRRGGSWEELREEIREGWNRARGR